MASISFSGSLQQKIGTGALILSLLGFVYPESFALAASKNLNTPTFHVANQNELLRQNENQKLKFMEVVKSDLYNQELEIFLKKYRSPFVQDIETLRKLPEMKRVLAISFVESTMGQRCYYYNCSGITLRSGKLKKYNSYAEWMIDLDSLLRRRYPQEKWEYKDMLGVYVVPGSLAWLNGTTKIHKELDALEAKINNTQYSIIPAQASQVVSK